MTPKHNNNRTMIGVLAAGILAIIYMIYVMVAPQGGHIQGWTPRASSTLAEGTDWVFNFINYWNYLFFIGVVAAMGYFIYKYQRKSDSDRTEKVKDSIAFEMFWVIFPTLLVMVVFVLGARDYMGHRVTPKNVYEIQATAFQWGWTFTYPNGGTSDSLVVPANQPVRMVMTSNDVLHSFYIPDFRVKQDVIPNRFTYVWFNAPKPTLKYSRPNDSTLTVSSLDRKHILHCTEYCGTSHSGMDRNVQVMAYNDFETWLEELTKVDESAEGGKKVFESKCQSCHSADGTPGIGPTWKGLWGSNRSVSPGGSVPADENYIRESILNPGAKVANGFPNAMTNFTGLIKDGEIKAIIEYMKTLK
ncbi:MAG: c-type cytochrome [Bacteroidetes Order II. Incertae sedis bacterium]|nr:c-type cytochrome [Bacteroidetes Order II. bacterium]